MIQIETAVFVAIVAILVTILGGVFTLAIAWGGQKEKQKTDREMILENRRSIKELCEENRTDHLGINGILDDVRKSLYRIEGKRNGSSKE